MAETNHKEYKVQPLPKMRRFAIDAGYLGRRRHIVHGLIEVEMEGKKVPMPYILKAVNKKSYLDVHREIRATQTQPHRSFKYGRGN